MAIGLGLTIGLLVSVLAVPSFFQQDRCMDNGGIWVGTPARCVCSYADLALRKDNPSELQVQRRAFCDAKPNGSMWNQEDVEAYRSLR
ncbi:MAG: hypothetical protein CMK09_09435 [Ponticaulis sp.]|nr:hypothetical protein [Ponticaulis sp.]